jgi:hypothetical protein
LSNGPARIRSRPCFVVSRALRACFSCSLIARKPRGSRTVWSGFRQLRRNRITARLGAVERWRAASERDSSSLGIES